mgnify:CR=1 FL=1
MNYDFDTVIDRHGTNSIKWGVYPEDVLPLWVADTDFAAAPPIVERIKKRIAHPIYGYTMDSPELVSAVQDRMRERYDWEINREDIVLVPGIVSGFNFASRAICEPGESVIFQTPIYPPFFAAPANNQLRTITNPLVFDREQETYRIDFEDFEQKIQKDTRLFILCNPHNPVGRVFSPEELTQLGEICCQKDLIICSDEIHSDIIYNGHKHTPIAALSPEIARRTITLIAPSKTFNIAGFSCSVAIIQNPDLRERFTAACKGFCSGVSFIAQEAGAAAYTECEDWLTQMNRYLEGNRDFLLDTIAREMPAVHTNPIEATYLAWLDCSDAGLPDKPHAFFLENAKVGLNDGAAFGTGYEKFVRLNFGTPRKILAEALERMSRALKKV